MNLSLCRFSLLTVLTTVSLTIFTGCSTAPTPSGPVAITKVNPYHLKPGMYVKTDESMIKFEQRHHLHGAVTSEQFQDKFGNYYTIFWKSESPGSQVTVRLEYCQANTGSEVHQISAKGAGMLKELLPPPPPCLPAIQIRELKFQTNPLN